ncbi:MAG TPA: bifunctional serine/threonine-protein kinase/formylglycine-generating enzyme family protein [Myxococcaceae bacterium]
MRKLGSGASGEVYLAHDQLLDRAVSVKFIKALDQESLRQFLLEARAAARIQHPNVVTLYRVGKLEEHSYLVSEYARGRSLDHLPKPLDWYTALSYALDLARGLSAAHRCGVLHRDLKPANAILTESGDVKLVDFGLAKLLGPEVPVPRSDPGLTPLPVPVNGGMSVAGIVVGTPYYMAPEVWRGESATVRSDLYSLGATLYELCSGHPPAHDLPTGAPIALAVQRADLPPLAKTAPSVQPAFAAIVDRCLRRDPAERFAAADEVLDALEVLDARGPRGPLPEGNPYRGLQAFEAEHRALFFGRRQAVQAVLDRLRGEPFLALTGDSGVGKSSLCLAGVLPAVAEGQLVDRRSWQVARMVPGRRPSEALAAALAPALVGVSEVVLERLVREEAQAFVRRVRGALPPDRGVLLYIDQMEELVTLSAPEEAAQVALTLEQFAAGVGGLKLLGSTRSDFLTRLAALPGLGAHLPRAVFLVRALTVEELREAVQAPARMKGVRFESEALVNDLVASAERAEGGLPLLQFALAELWEARNTATQVITERSVAAIGGVGGALARHAESVLRALLPEQRAAARAVLLRLVTASGTRARRSEAELLAVHPSAKAALEALVRGRLVVVREAEGSATYEVAHEAILTGCATLAGWLGEEAETKAARERLSLAAVEWERRGRDRELLWGAGSLEEASDVKAEGLTPGELEFLETSRRAVWRRRQRYRAAAVAGVLLLAVSGVVVQAVLSRQKERAVDEQRERSQAALVQARARVEALAKQRSEAYRLFDEGSDGAEQAWLGVRATEREADGDYSEAAVAMESAIAISGGRDSLRRELGQIFLERALLAEDAHHAELRDFFVEQMRINDPGGALERTWTRPATVEISEPRGAAITAAQYERRKDGSFETRQLQVSGVVPATLTFPPGSYLLQVGKISYPLLLRRGETRAVTLPEDLPVRPGFVYIPAGRFLFGSGDEDSVRQFMQTAPIHTAETGPYFIARWETTYAQWREFLEALPPAELQRRLPRVTASSMFGTLSLVPPASPAEKWVFELRVSGTIHRAREGEPLTYPGRDRRVSQDWLQFPVAGISFEDAQAYARWLDQTGRVPGARLCTEREWERAARGADDRKFPHGDRLLPDDTNYDQTYGKKPDGFGPDVVGSHPASRSPFGIDDMAGNVMEWTVTSAERSEPVNRGGDYYEYSTAERVENRNEPEPTYRDPTLGLRLCASVSNPLPSGSRP